MIQWLARDLIQGPNLALVTSAKQYRMALKFLMVSERDAGPWLSCGSDARTHTFYDGSGQLSCIVAIMVSKKASQNAVVGLLIHEAVHVWQQYADSIGERAPSSEFEAYSIQVISQRLIESYYTKNRLKP